MTEELTDESDHQILMHRDAHFGGDFGVMLDYYQQDQLGVQPDIEIERIAYLAEVEKELDQDLAPMILSGSEAEAVARARLAYRQLKAIYDIEGEASALPRQIADLVLAESEDPQEEIEALVAQGEKAVGPLLELARSSESFDPLFPGYGYAPYFAMLCLGRLGRVEAIPLIFDTLGEEGALGEEMAIDALKALGEPAKTYLIGVVTSRPLSSDNVHAAFALTAFPDDVEVAKWALSQLQDPEVLAQPVLPIYLLCACDPLKETTERETFLALASAPTTPKRIREEIENIALDWQ